MRIINKQISELKSSPQFLKEFTANKLSFEYHVGTFMETYYFPERKIRYSFSDSFKSFYELNLIMAVKRECEKNSDNIILPDDFNINYFRYSEKLYNKLEPGEIRTFKGDNISEIDISAAYFYAAKNNNLISPELFEKIIALPKNKRLPILGAIASIKTAYYYEDGLLNEEKTHLIVNRKLRKIWFYLCSIIDDIINSLANELKNDFLFYYVDGIYFIDRKNKSEKIIEKLNSINYVCKKKGVNKIEIINCVEHFKLFCYKENEEEPTEFNFTPDEIKFIL